MADSKRLTVLKTLCTYLMAEIQEANGYKHSLDPQRGVQRGRLEYTREDPLPGLSILEDVDPDRFPRPTANEGRAPVIATQWTLLVQGWAADDAENPTDPAYELMADTVKALARISFAADPTENVESSALYNLGGLIAGLSMEPGVVRPPAEGVSSKAFFWMRVTLKFIEDQNDPYKLDIS